MSTKKMKSWFKNQLVLLELVGENTRVFTGKLMRDFRDGFAFIFVNENENIHINDQGRSRVIHGKEFQGSPRITKMDPQKAHLGASKGAPVLYVEPRSKTGKPHSGFWMLVSDIQNFMERLEHEPTIRVQSRHKFAEPSCGVKIAEGSPWETHFVGFRNVFTAMFSKADSTMKFRENIVLEDGSILESRFQRWDFDSDSWEPYKDPRKPIRINEPFEVSLRRNLDGDFQEMHAGDPKPCIEEKTSKIVGLGVALAAAGIDSEDWAKKTTQKVVKKIVKKRVVSKPKLAKAKPKVTDTVKAKKKDDAKSES